MFGSTSRKVIINFEDVKFNFDMFDRCRVKLILPSESILLKLIFIIAQPKTHLNLKQLIINKLYLFLVELRIIRFLHPTKL